MSRPQRRVTPWVGHPGPAEALLSGRLSGMQRAACRYACQSRLEAIAGSRSASIWAVALYGWPDDDDLSDCADMGPEDYAVAATGWRQEQLIAALQAVPR